MSRPVLLDADPGCDDALAILLALASPDLDLVGVTTVAGNASVADTTDNALRVLETLGRGDVPVAAGCDRPLVHDLDTAEFVHGPGGIRGPLDATTATPVETHATEFIVEQARQHDGDLVVVALGPLTNLAVALATEPELPAMLDEVRLMGGTTGGVGNATPAAEANFHLDPAAASRVVADADPRIVGLNVTGYAGVPERVLADAPATTAADAIAAWLSYYPDDLLAQFGYDRSPQHDAVVVADLVADVLAFDRYHVDVATDGRHRGAMVHDRHGVTDEAPNAAVATALSRDAFVNTVESAIETTLSRLDGA
jgi:purine nucleosidase